MKIILFILLFTPVFFQAQQCLECPGQTASLSVTPTGPSPYTYSWTCTDGSSSTNATHTTNAVNGDFTCIVNVTDADGCVATDNKFIEIIDPPTLTIQESNCVITWATLDLGDNTCTGFDVQYRLNSGSSWSNVGTSLPFTIDTDGQYQISYNCDCANYESNILTASGCLGCSPFNVINWGDCDIIVSGSVPCSGGTYTVWQYIDNSIVCGPTACDLATFTVYETGTSLWYFVNNDGCYYMTVSCNGTDYCSNVVCFADDCDIGCNLNIITNQTGCTLNVTWANCTTTNWTLEYIENSSWVVHTSGTTSPPTSFAIPFNGTWRVTQICDDGCNYSSATNNFTTCGAPACSNTTTVTIVQNPVPCTSTATLTAVVSDCGNNPPYSPTYAWSNSATTQSINVGSGTYSVTVSDCCQVASDIHVLTCNNPCQNYDVVINGLTAICDDETTTLTSSITAGQAPFSYAWQINGSAAGTGSTLLIDGANYGVGTINVTLSVTDDNSCNDIDNHSIQINSCPAPCDCDPIIVFDDINCELDLSVNGPNCANYDNWALLKWNNNSCGGGNSTLQTGTVASLPISISVNEDTGYQMIISGPSCTTDITSCEVVTNCGCSDNPSINEVVVNDIWTMKVYDNSNNEDFTDPEHIDNEAIVNVSGVYKMFKNNIEQSSHTYNQPGQAYFSFNRTIPNGQQKLITGSTIKELYCAENLATPISIVIPCAPGTATLTGPGGTVTASDLTLDLGNKTIFEDAIKAVIENYLSSQSLVFDEIKFTVSGSGNPTFGLRSRHNPVSNFVGTTISNVPANTTGGVYVVSGTEYSLTSPQGETDRLRVTISHLTDCGSTVTYNKESASFPFDDALCNFNVHVMDNENSMQLTSGTSNSRTCTYTDLTVLNECDRKDKYVKPYVMDALGKVNEDQWSHHFNNNVKDTFEDEIADIMIRCMDLAAFKGIDLEAHIKSKVRFNTLRKYKHGKNY